MPTFVKPSKLSFLSRLFSTLFMTVLAEGEQTDPPATPPAAEPPAATPPAAPPAEPKPSGTINYEELIAAARKQEKDKLYPEIDKWKQKSNEHLLVIGERDKEIARLTKALEKSEKERDEAVAKGATAGTAEQSARISTLEREVEHLNGVIAQKDLEVYTAQKLSEVGASNLIPELVRGATKEEIDASIEASRQRLAAITQSALNGAQIPPANPASSQVDLKMTKTADEIARMTPKEYAEYRKSIGMK